MTQPEFEQKLSPSQPKGWLWTLLKGVIIKWLYENAETILPILLEKVFGVKKANRFLIAMLDDDRE